MTWERKGPGSQQHDIDLLTPKYSSLKTSPANIVRDKYVIITSKRRFDVIIAYLLRTLFAGWRVKPATNEIGSASKRILMNKTVLTVKKDYVTFALSKYMSNVSDYVAFIHSYVLCCISFWTPQKI